MINSSEKNQFVFRMNDDGTGPHLLQQVCLERGWRLYGDKKRCMDLSTETWNLWWRTKRFPVFERRPLDKNQFINHISNASFICRKDNLIRMLKCMRRIYGPLYDFIPEGYNLPSEYKKLQAAIKVSKQKTTNFDENNDIWICKPVGLSRGRGISLFRDFKFNRFSVELNVRILGLKNVFMPLYRDALRNIFGHYQGHTQRRAHYLTTFALRGHPLKMMYSSDLVYSSKAVVQKYVKNPLLVGGYKFDLRLYVLVPSFHPLTVYIYREGLVRFGTEKFSLKNLQNTFAHLTNTSLNKSSPGYLKTKERIGTGCKWNLQQLRCYLRQTIGSNWLLWQNISVIIVLTLVSQLSKISRSVNSFEFYGFDILIDSALKPWLIEVNSSPALTIDCKIDLLVKRPMLHDMFDLIGLPYVCENLPKSGESLLRTTLECNETLSSRRTRTSRLKARENITDRNFKPSEGNWVRIFPLLADEHDHIKFSTRYHRTNNEIRSVVTSAMSFLKIAQEVQMSNPDLEESELNDLMTHYLLPDATVWLPPL